jgi:hypothetical protein
LAAFINVIVPVRFAMSEMLPRRLLLKHVANFLRMLSLNVLFAAGGKSDESTTLALP